ncbi:MAG: hypothetical protein GX605_08475 [Chloroflexi bacterium]|nr:hypothetical protein [Chloroflexota bacterium]
MWDRAAWQAFFAQGESFRPALSLLLRDGPEPVAYAVCDVEGAEGQVVQMGVRPAWRRRGLAG